MAFVEALIDGLNFGLYIITQLAWSGTMSVLTATNLASAVP